MGVLLLRLCSAAPLLLCLWWAAFADWRWRRVPNWVSFGLLLGGLLLSAVPTAAESSWITVTIQTLPRALLGLGVGAGIGLALYALGAIGAGDVKLLAALGVWLGPWLVLLAFSGAALIGMGLSVVQAIRIGRFRSTVRDAAILGANLAAGQAPPLVGSLAHVSGLDDDRMRQARTVPFAVALAASATGVLVARAIGLA